MSFDSKIYVDTETGAQNLWSLAGHFMTTGGGFWVLLHSTAPAEFVTTKALDSAVAGGGRCFRVNLDTFAAWFPSHEAACTFAVAVQERSPPQTPAHATIIDDVMDFGAASEPGGRFYIQDFTFSTENHPQILSAPPAPDDIREARKTLPRFIDWSILA